ncbi:MAG: fatty acid desaturase family protein [Planctomycetales bacterium]|nr:fatty acid desaturase family protein [Planctomycetales bacterium]
MNEVDAILANHQVSITEAGPELAARVERYPRAPHAEIVKQLSHVSGWRSTVTIAMQWGMIIAALLAGAYFPYWWVYVLGGIVIGTRMQAMGVLLHEAAHYALYRNRTLNDIVGDLTVAFPIGMSMTLYRKTHFRHHRFTNTDQDQDLAAQREEGEWFEWPKTKAGLAWAMIRALLGVNTHKAWILYKHWAPWNNLFKPVDADFPLRSRVLYVLSVIVIYGVVGWGILHDWRTTVALCLMYVVPSITLLNFINRIRATAEHVGTEQTHELNATRTVLPTLFERMTIAPLNVSYHLEHHLFPSVPAYQLPKLHAHLMEDQEFREHAHLTHSYIGFFREVMSLPPHAEASTTANVEKQADDDEH